MRSTPLFAFSPKESGHFSLYAKKYYKSIAKVLRQSHQTLFLFFLDANRTLPEDRRVGAFPKFTDLASCDSHKLLVLDDTASGLGDKVLH